MQNKLAHAIRSATLVSAGLEFHSLPWFPTGVVEFNLRQPGYMANIGAFTRTTAWENVSYAVRQAGVLC